MIHAWLVRNLERLIEELAFHRVQAGKLALQLAYAEGPDGIGDGPLDAPTDRFDLLLETARIALREAWRPGTVTHMHLFATHLRGGGVVQRTLFDPPSKQLDAVARVKREVNAACGRFSLRSGATLPLREVYGDPSNEYDICDVRGKICF